MLPVFVHLQHPDFTTGYQGRFNCNVECTRWCRWWRHCATSRKVAGSIPGGVLPAMASTQPLTKISTRNIYWE